MEYHQLVVNIPVLTEHTVTMGLYEVHRSNLVDAMVASAAGLRDQVLSRMTQNYQTACKQLGEEYASIAEKALSTPRNTEELMEHISYVYKVENEIVYEMEDRLREVTFLASTIFRCYLIYPI